MHTCAGWLRITKLITSLTHRFSSTVVQTVAALSLTENKFAKTNAFLYDSSFTFNILSSYKYLYLDIS